MRHKIYLVLICVIFTSFSLQSLLGDYSKKEIEKLEKDIIGI